MKFFRSPSLFSALRMRPEKNLLSSGNFVAAGQKSSEKGKKDKKASRGRRLTLEILEDRRLLTALPGTIQELPLSGAGNEIVVTTLIDDPEDTEISLQEAVAEAKSGDTITFAASLSGKTITLAEELSLTKGITIDASGLAGGITIDAQNKCRLFSASGGTLDNPIQLINLTLTGGNADNGGGISCTKGYLQVTNCTITANTASIFGGGIYNMGTVTITGTKTGSSYLCSIQSNKANFGGGIYNEGSLTIDGVSISQNEVIGQTIEIEGEVFVIAGIGGGIYNKSVFSMENSEAALNKALGSYSLGGGIYNEGRGTVNCCTVSGNTAVIGGGFCCTCPESASSTMNLSNSLIIQNQAAGNDAQGGGVNHLGGDLTITNCTIAGNTVTNSSTGTESQNGGGICASTEKITFYNTIIVQNTADGKANDIQHNPYISKGQSVYGVISGYRNLTAFSGWTSTASEGNRLYDASQKLFTNSQTRDYTLCEGSQALDWGDNQYTAGTHDLAQEHRISNKIVDIGAYELQVIIQRLEKIEVSTAVPTYSDEEATVITTAITPNDREVTYQWYRGISQNIEDMKIIDTAKSDTYQVTEYDLGLYLMVMATEVGEDEPISVTAYTGKVLPAVPVVWLDASEYQVQEGCTACFSGNSYYNFYDNLTFYWDVTGSAEEKAENFTAGGSDYYLCADNLPFAIKTTVPIRMYAVDEYGHKSETVSASFSVTPVEPSVIFTTTEYHDGQILKLSLNFSSVHQENITGWTLSWGDGSQLDSSSTAAQLQAAHYYENPGNYQISLTVTGDGQKTLFDGTLTQYSFTAPQAGGLQGELFFTDAGREAIPEAVLLFAPEPKTEAHFLTVPKTAVPAPQQESEEIRQSIQTAIEKSENIMEENWDFLNEETISSYTDDSAEAESALPDGEIAVFL